jgi:hypothetical protein
LYPSSPEFKPHISHMCSRSNVYLNICICTVLQKKNIDRARRRVSWQRKSKARASRLPRGRHVETRTRSRSMNLFQPCRSLHQVKHRIASPAHTSAGGQAAVSSSHSGRLLCQTAAPSAGKPLVSVSQLKHSTFVPSPCKHGSLVLYAWCGVRCTRSVAYRQEEQHMRDDTLYPPDSFVRFALGM